ncbi:hypothetical protein AHMF7605_28900 [Adhaeribacter arboris]|uniref:Uncharacterized protein n=1 Tax=Adhaeribacter arboris TaxID=2072846 RepID=A0A2T2Y8T5_9BACT|nr:hypothetical protein [Adhaeribacter arboris]PSR51930.1 hypothetical protein AHMF7605_28900 [Adhaeribacter arboris]
MEWGNFLIAIVAVYLAYYGLNFLFDLLIAGGPKLPTGPATQYNVRDLMDEEEPAQVVEAKDYEDKLVDIRPISFPPISSDNSAGDGSGSSISDARVPEPVTVETMDYSNDWASEIDQEETNIEIPIQGQALSVSDFLKSLKDEAKLETATITF